MSRWKEKLEAHQIHETIAILLDCVNEIVTEPDEKYLQEKRRAQKYLLQIQNSVDTLDAEIISFPLLDQLDKKLRASEIWDKAHSYKASPQLGILTEVNDQLTPLSPILAQLSSGSTLDASLVSAEHAFEGLLISSAKKVEKVHVRIEAESKAISDMDAKLENLGKQLKDLDVTNAGKLTEWEKSFRDSQTELHKQFTDENKVQLQEYEDWYAAFSNEANANLKEAQSNTNSQLESIILDAQNKHKEILEIFGLVATDSVGAGYFSTSNSEKWKAFGWSALSVIFIVLAAAWVGCAYYMDFTQISEFSNTLKTYSSQVAGIELGSNLAQYSWGQTVKAASLTIVLLYGAYYSARQSADHRSVERSTRRFALEVKAFDPFIRSLESTQQAELKAKIAERMFAQSETAQPDRNGFGSAKALDQLFDRIKKEFDRSTR